MSTRCQVMVRQAGVNWKQEVTLYHHTDGYPENMIPLFQEAWDKFGGSWEAGRAGKVASFLCAVDPGTFEPEEGHKLRGDIEYYYVLTLINKDGGCVGDRPIWVVDVYEPLEAFYENNKGAKFDNLKKIDSIKIEKEVANEIN